MIKLTNGASYTINPDLIVIVESRDSGSRITISNGLTYGADQSHEEVTRKILEYKLMKQKYNAYMLGLAMTQNSEVEDYVLTNIELMKIGFNNLAGLEVPHDQA